MISTGVRRKSEDKALATIEAEYSLPEAVARSLELVAKAPRRINPLSRPKSAFSAP
jgi:hypothetical protein